MAIAQARFGEPGSEQGLGVDVGAQAGTGQLTRGDAGAHQESVNRGQDSSVAREDTFAGAASGMKVIKPLPHAVIDYAWAGTMIAAPWLFGFSRNRKARRTAVGSGIGILGLSLFTRYPLGAVRAIPFPVHGVVETLAGVMTAAAPWLMGFSRDRGAKWTHAVSGLGTLAVVAMTDYNAAQQQDGADADAVEEDNHG